MYIFLVQNMKKPRAFFEEEYRYKEWILKK
jgi:hypothetical protein